VFVLPFGVIGNGFVTIGNQSEVGSIGSTSEVLFLQMLDVLERIKTAYLLSMEEDSTVTTTE